eukprot:gene4828-biopygen7460
MLDSRSSSVETRQYPCYCVPATGRNSTLEARQWKLGSRSSAVPRILVEARHGPSGGRRTAPLRSRRGALPRQIGSARGPIRGLAASRPRGPARARTHHPLLARRRRGRSCSPSSARASPGAGPTCASTPRAAPQPCGMLGTSGGVGAGIAAAAPKDDDDCPTPRRLATRA